MDDKTLKTFEDFLAEHPEINAEWGEFIEPDVQDAEKDLYAFLLSYIFM